VVLEVVVAAVAAVPRWFRRMRDRTRFPPSRLKPTSDPDARRCSLPQRPLDPSTGVVRTASVLGTAAYMAPEQLAGKVAFPAGVA
jgi:hypothetical protein